MSITVKKSMLWNATGLASGEAQIEPNLGSACLYVQGEDRPGLAQQIASQIAANGIEISFVFVQSTATHYQAVFGFFSGDDAERAVPIIKDAEELLAKQTSRRNLKLLRGKSARSKGTTRGGRTPRAMLNSRKTLRASLRSARRRA